MLDFLTKTVSDYQFENKEVQITKQNIILKIALTETMDICTHEGDTRIIIPLLRGAEKQMKNVIIRIVGGDILRIVLGKFE